jgi:serine phosphatase RsbU (regulator of sigma subunit)
LLVGVDGSRAVSIKAEPPFGVGLPHRHALAMNLDLGDSVVLITDGLVERRGEDIDEGIGRVLAAAAGSAATSAGELLEHVLAAATPGGHDDDVTVLVIRRT